MNIPTSPGKSVKNPVFSRAFQLFPIVGLGVLACLMIWWNGKQAETLLTWAREREGRQQWLNLQNEASGPLRELVDHPEILEGLIEQSSAVVAAGIMGPQNWLHCSAKNGAPSVASYSAPPPESARFIGEGLVIARFHFRGGPRGGHPGEGQGKGRRFGPGGGWGSEFSEAPSADCGRAASSSEIVNTTTKPVGGPFEIVLVFPDIDQSLVFPLRVQQVFWVLIWVIASGLWLFALYTHERNLALHEVQRHEAHLSSVGRVTARLAHEIKNPLGAIRGTAQHLQKKLKEQPGVQDLLGMIESETIRLEELARGILDFSRPSEFHPVPIDIIPILKECIQLLSQKFPGRNLHFSSDLETMIISADPNALRQVLINLIHNAIEADEQANPVEIQVKRQEGTMHIQILDQGPGLSAEAMDRLFEPFFSSKTKGYGLGLVICKKIMESHKGSFTLTNRAKGGCCAELLFPVGGQE